MSDMHEDEMHEELEAPPVPAAEPSPEPAPPAEVREAQVSPEERIAALEAAVKGLKTRNASLEGKIAALKSPKTPKAQKKESWKPAPVQPIPGQARQPHGNLTGSMCVLPPSEPNGSVASGTHHFNNYRTIDGVRRFCPDGIPRDENGEVWRPAPEAPPLVPRDGFHQRQVELLDRLMAQDEARQRLVREEDQ